MVTPTFSLCGRPAGMALMALGWLWWGAWALLVAGDTAALCMAGVALGDIHLRFAWQVWHLVTSTFSLRGRRGTWRHPPSFSAAGVALGDIYTLFAWQASHILGWLWWGALAALVAGDTAALCVAGVALGDIHLRFAWQTCHSATSTLVLPGQRGTWPQTQSSCVAAGC